MQPYIPEGTSRAPMVLVVDDEAELRRCLAMVLEEEGYVVRTAPHGGVALDMVREVSPDLIVLDVQMPQVDGITFARAYRELPIRRAPIVLLTASDRGEIVADEVGAAALLAKPFDIDDLVAKVHACLAGATAAANAVSATERLTRAVAT